MNSDSQWIAATLSRKSPTAWKNAEKESPSEAKGTPNRLGDVDGAARDRRRLHDRGGGLAVDDEAVDELLQVLDVAHRRLHEEAVLAGDAVALDDLGRRARQVGDLVDLARGRADADHRRQRVAERARIHAGVVAGDNAVALEPLDALGDRGRRETDPPSELGEADAAVALELCEDSTVGEVVLPLIVRHH